MITVKPKEDTSMGDVLDIAEALGWHDTFPNNVEEGWNASVCDECEADAVDYINQVFERVFERLFDIQYSEKTEDNGD